jgi:hypothetical protein
VALAVQEGEYGEGGGYVVDGFPASAAQARALELALGGVGPEHVPPLPPPPVPSLLAPPPVGDAGDVAAGGEKVSRVLCVVWLEGEAHALLPRALGRLDDPESPGGAGYNADSDPPPGDDKALAARLAPVEDAAAAAAAYWRRRGAWDVQAVGLAAWVDRVGARVVVPGLGDVAEVAEQVRVGAVAAGVRWRQAGCVSRRRQACCVCCERCSGSVPPAATMLAE